MQNGLLHCGQPLTPLCNYDFIFQEEMMDLVRFIFYFYNIQIKYTYILYFCRSCCVCYVIENLYYSKNKESERENNKRQILLVKPKIMFDPKR